MKVTVSAENEKVPLTRAPPDVSATLNDTESIPEVLIRDEKVADTDEPMGTEDAPLEGEADCTVGPDANCVVKVHV